MGKLSKQNQWLHDYLQDGKWHAGDEIRRMSRLHLGKEITLHPRITDLREEGFIIQSRRKGRSYVFCLTGRGEPSVTNGQSRVTQSNKAAVQGFIFHSWDDSSPRSGDVCQVTGRANATANDVLIHGPAFSVRFGDGEEDTAYADELNPWYPVD